MDKNVAVTSHFLIWKEKFILYKLTLLPNYAIRFYSQLQYLEAAIVEAELLSQHGIKRIKAFLLQAAVHQNMNNLPFLPVL